MKTELKNPLINLRIQNLSVLNQDDPHEYDLINTARSKLNQTRVKSGRTWKTLKEDRFSSIKKVKPLRTKWHKKMDLKKKHKFAKEHEKELYCKRSDRLCEKRKRSEMNKKLKEENARKSEIVQPIKNSAKLKRMKKKQLRTIEKR